MDLSLTVLDAAEEFLVVSAGLGGVVVPPAVGDVVFEGSGKHLVFEFTEGYPEDRGALGGLFDFHRHLNYPKGFELDRPRVRPVTFG